MTLAEEIGRYAVLVEKLLRGDERRGPLDPFRTHEGLYLTLDHSVKIPSDKADWVHNLLDELRIPVADER